MHTEGTTALEATGPLLGLGPLPGRWHTATVDLPSTSSLLVYTDGLLEARNEQREPYDPSRLDELVDAHRKASPAGLVSALTGDLAAFTGGTFGDDVTVVAVSRQRGVTHGDEPSYVQTFPVADVGVTETPDSAQGPVGSMAQT